MKRLNWIGFVGEYEEINLKRTVNEIESAAGDDIEIYLHTKGGDIYEARSIYQKLKEYPGKVTINLGGIVASAGTTISLAADEIVAESTTAYMIHNAWAVVVGDYRDMAKAANQLRKENGSIAAELAERSGKSKDEIIDMMNEETWLYGQEIIDAGFADSLNGKKSEEGKDVAIENARLEIAACVKKVANISHYLHLNTGEGKNQISQEDVSVNTKEAIELLKAEMNSVEIANAFGIKILNKDDAVILTALQENDITDPVATIEELRNQLSDTEDDIRSAKLTDAFGQKGTDENPNLKRDYAEKVTANTAVKKLDEELANLKNDKVMQSFAKDEADNNSTLNVLDNENKNGSSGIKHVKC